MTEKSINSDTPVLTLGELRVIADTDHAQCGDAAAMALEIIGHRNAASELQEYRKAGDRCAALAAENAGLISSSECLLHEASEVYRAYNKTQLPDGDLVDEQCLQEVYDAINATPVTDAFLAEVRAQGVEMLANFCATANNGYEIHPDIEEIRLFATQLRKGVQS